MVTLGTPCLNNTKFCMLSITFIDVLCMILIHTEFISLNNKKQLVFVPDMQCVFCETGIKYYLDEFQASEG